VAAALENIIETRGDSGTAELLARECQEGRAEKGNNSLGSNHDKLR